MKIILVSEFYYPHLGGITEHVHHLARHLARSGHEVLLITSHVAESPRRVDREWVAGYEVVRVGLGVPVQSNDSQSRVTVGFGLEGRMRELIRGADLVHVHSPLFPMLPYVALKAARRFDVPTVGTFHTNFARSLVLGFFGPLMREYARALDSCIAVSQSAARAVSALVDAPFTVIPNGVDVAAWSSGERLPELAGRQNVVFLGRMDPRNDVDVLLAAFAQVARARADARLVLVGDGPRRAAYESQVPQDLRERFFFAGARASVAARARFLASASMMVFTARIASHPVALIEGFASGIPVVGYDIEGVRELITDGKQGYKVSVGDVDRLAGAVQKVLESEGRRLLMGRLARSSAETFDWRHIAARIQAVYRSVCSGQEVSSASLPELISAQ